MGKSYAGLKKDIDALISKLSVDDMAVLFIKKNEDGTFGTKGMTEKQFADFVEAKGFKVVLIDDVPEDDED